MNEEFHEEIIPKFNKKFIKIDKFVFSVAKT